MKTITVNADAPQEILLIGRRGESGVTEVRFEVGAWLEEFGSGALALFVKRSGDAAAYPVALTAEVGAAVWTVSDTDTNVKGYGRAELVLTLGTVVKKSAVWQIYVGCDIGQPTGDPPDPYESWLETLAALGAETQENAEAAADSASDAASSASDAADSADAAAASAEAAAAAAAHGIPAGGTRGQVLTKLSDEDFDAGFEDPAVGALIVTAVMDGLEIMADHTYAELAAAAQADTPIVLLLTDGATEYVCTSYKVYASKISFDLKPQWVDIVGSGVTNLMSYRVDVNGDGWEFWVSQQQLTASSIGAGTYSKPSSGIPKSDLASAVQTSLGNADAALPRSGGTMTGAIAMGSHKITGLSNGTNNADAVNLGQVSDMISTNTAYFRGSFASLAALQAVPWQTANPSAANYVTNNDYAIVLDDEDHDDECWRYVYTTGTGWIAQYRINEAPMTVAQLAALNSGATAEKIAQIAGKIDAPASASADDVLTFKNGAWGAAAAKKEIFVATYGTTTSAEIEAAYQAGMMIYCDYNGDIYSLAFRTSATVHAFTAVLNGTSISAIFCSNNTWNDAGVSSLALASDIPTVPSDIGAAPAITEVAVSTAGAVTQALDAGKLYHFTGALTALTVTLNAAGTGVIPQYHFDFDSGAAAPTLTLPNTVTMPDGFAVEANKHYEVDILNGYGVVSAWATS